MANADYHVFGLGWSSDDLRYIGWTQRSLGEEKEHMSSDFAHGDLHGIPSANGEAIDGSRLSLFEIESVPSIEDAKGCVISLCQYFKSLGLDVFNDLC